MEMDLYYIKMFLSPFLGFSIALLVLKCCCRRRCFPCSSASEPQRRDAPVYVIPIPVSGDDSDRGSLSSAATFAPPPYDSVVLVIPPPPYSEWKASAPAEEPPAYAEILEQPPSVSGLAPQTQRT